VDVLACRAGATRTPGYAASQPKKNVPTMEADTVVAKALAALGHGPSMVPGALNRFAAFLFGRLLPRRTSIRIMGRATERLYR
jgi:short-subunit dehydrogenase